MWAIPCGTYESPNGYRWRTWLTWEHVAGRAVPDRAGCAYGPWYPPTVRDHRSAQCSTERHIATLRRLGPRRKRAMAARRIEQSHRRSDTRHGSGLVMSPTMAVCGRTIEQ